MLSRTLGQGVLFVEGEQHKMQRRIMVSDVIYLFAFGDVMGVL